MKAKYSYCCFSVLLCRMKQKWHFSLYRGLHAHEAPTNIWSSSVKLHHWSWTVASDLHSFNRICRARSRRNSYIISRDIRLETVFIFLSFQFVMIMDRSVMHHSTIFWHYVYRLVVQLYLELDRRCVFSLFITIIQHNIRSLIRSTSRYPIRDQNGSIKNNPYCDRSVTHSIFLFASSMHRQNRLVYINNKPMCLYYGYCFVYPGRIQRHLHQNIDDASHVNAIDNCLQWTMTTSRPWTINSNLLYDLQRMLYESNSKL